jgi:hypothetical protein
MDMDHIKFIYQHPTGKMCLFMQEYNISMKNIPEGTDVEHIKKCLYFFSYFCVSIFEEKKLSTE